MSQYLTYFEDFWLTVTEALWKGRPVVTGKAGGIPLQIEYVVSGFVASTTAEYVDYVLYLLKHPGIANGMGNRGKTHARQNFLLTRNLADYLRLFGQFSRDEYQIAAGSEQQEWNVTQECLLAPTLAAVAVGQ
jgi:glycosyltransferase involved in cell wall biosynthesis